MANQFMKKCSECGSFGAHFQTTNEKGEAIQLCNACKQKFNDKTPNAALTQPTVKE